MLKLVAPATMNADAQMVWLQAAVDALEGIRANEVAEVSYEVRRTITHHRQIVPEVARLVAARRAESARYSRALEGGPLPPPLPRLPAPPMTQKQLDALPKWLRDMGLRNGWLKHENGRLVEA